MFLKLFSKTGAWPEGFNYLGTSAARHRIASLLVLDICVSPTLISFNLFHYFSVVEYVFCS